MKKIIIIGTSGHAAELWEYVQYANRLNPAESMEIVGFIDDQDDTYRHYGFPQPFIGPITGHQPLNGVQYLMGIANLKFRQMVIEDLKRDGASFTGFIHPTALIASSAKIGEGVVISHNASVGPMAQIGNFCILNSRCTIGHDSILGDYNFISPQVAISGNTIIGSNNLLGTNSATIPGIKIGDRNKIGAGAVVIKDVPSDVTVVGNKATILEKK